MDVRTSAALRIVLADARDEVIAELQARNASLHRTIVIGYRNTMTKHLFDYMCIASEILSRTDAPHRDTAINNPFFSLLPRHLYRCVREAGYGLRAAVTIRGHNYSAGQLRTASLAQTTIGFLLIDSITAQLHLDGWISASMQLHSFILNVSIYLDIPPGIFCVL